MPHPRSHVMITGGARMTSLTAEIEAGEVAIIKYFASCYRRAFEECKKWKVCPLSTPVFHGGRCTFQNFGGSGCVQLSYLGLVL